MNSNDLEKKSLFLVIKEYFIDPKLTAKDLLTIVAFIITLLLCSKFFMPISDVFTKTTDISYGYNSKQDYSGAYYVVDRGHSRLLCFDKNSDIHNVLLPTDTEGSNLYIDDFTAENGCIYLSASVWDGMMLKKEMIAEFRGEKYIRTVTE
ncbi:MAG: hypothetical protein IJ736_12300, partial [Firmicutes bacterium]|nr:hypothetical protein [Bacillota bacterium]